MPRAPVGQQMLQRFAIGGIRTPSRRPPLCGASTLSGSNHVIDSSRLRLTWTMTSRPAGVRHIPKARRSKIVTPSILEPGDAAADRRHVDAQRLRGMQKAAGFDCHR